MVENLRKMQELRAQIQAQLKLADTLKKLNENAGSILRLAWFRVEIVPKSDTLKNGMRMQDLHTWNMDLWKLIE